MNSTVCTCHLSRTGCRTPIPVMGTKHRAVNKAHQPLISFGTWQCFVLVTIPGFYFPELWFIVCHRQGPNGWNGAQGNPQINQIISHCLTAPDKQEELNKTPPVTLSISVLRLQVTHIRHSFRNFLFWGMVKMLGLVMYFTCLLVSIHTCLPACKRRRERAASLTALSSNNTFVCLHRLR